ncbi:MAG: ROK family protein [Microbacterium sp.]
MKELVLAVDLGGTKVEVALVDEVGHVVPGSRFRRPTGARLTSEMLHGALVQLVRSATLNAPAPVVGVGIGSAGPIDFRAGAIVPVNLPGVHGMPLRDAVASAAQEAGLGDLPVLLGHDGGCLALAESWLGATAGARASFSMVVSTGIGGGYVIDGRLVSGASGNAGHLGQMRLGGFAAVDAADAGIPPTVEEIAAGPGSVAWARAQGWTGETGVELGAAAGAGDAVARATVERSARAVGAVLASAVAVLDVEVVAIGGGFSRVSADYVGLVGAALRAHAALDFVRDVRVVPAALGDDGPLVGAAALVWRR